VKRGEWGRGQWEGLFGRCAFERAGTVEYGNVRVGAQEAAGLQTSLSEFGPARVQVQLLDKGQGRDVGLAAVDYSLCC
jgi:hypothetical protein